MIDREEVLKGLKHHRHLEASRNELSHDECFDCPYRPDGEDTCASLDHMIDDALELLKDQEPKAIAYKENRMTGLPVAICPRCGKFARQFDMAHYEEETHFCPWCGQAVKWDG